jgi:hypothetical protein
MQVGRRTRQRCHAARLVGLRVIRDHALRELPDLVRAGFLQRELAHLYLG